MTNPSDPESSIGFADAVRHLVREIRRTAPPMVMMDDVEVAAALSEVETWLGEKLPPASPAQTGLFDFQKPVEDDDPPPF